MRNILIAESDDLTLRTRGDELLLDGYEVLAAQTDTTARARLADSKPDALVLGTLDTPAHSLQLLRDLRAGQIPRADTHLRVLSTGADTDPQTVRHYQAGTNIALPSTASPLLIAAGLKGLAYREEEPRRRILRLGSLTVDCDARTATIDNRPVPLTRLEFDLLQTLARQPHNAHTRQQLAQPSGATTSPAAARSTATPTAYAKNSKPPAPNPSSKPSGASATASPTKCNNPATTSTQHRANPPQPPSGSSKAVNVYPMSRLQQITHNGELVAITLADQAIIDDTLPASEQPHVQAMCLYALQIQAGELPGPYTDAKANAYAHAAAHDA